MTFRSAAELAENPALMAAPPSVTPLAAKGRVSLATCGPKGGKTTTALGAVATATQGGARVAVIQVDEALADTLQKLARFGADLSRVWVADTFEPAALAVDMATLAIDLLVVDYLGKLAERNPEFTAGSQGDPILWGRLVQPFTDLARDQDMAVLLLDQARRSDGRWAGSVAKGGGVDLIVELLEREGGLEATPKGRVTLAPFRVELDQAGIPVFTISGAADAPDAGTADRRELTGKSIELLKLLADAEPEGLASSRWHRLAKLPETTYHRLRRQLVRGGLVMDPSQTGSRRYRITTRGEALVVEVPTCHGSVTETR